MDMKQRIEVEKLNRLKDAAMYEFIGKCEVINDQIRQIKSQKQKSNYAVVKDMNKEDLAVFIEDIEGYANPDHAWQSKILPPLPFESWADWLKREAEYENI